MSGIISDHMMMGVMLIFASALICTGINLFLVLSKDVRMMQSKYENAIVTQTSNTVDELVNRNQVSFPDMYKALCAGSMNIDRIKITYLDGNVVCAPYTSVLPYLLKDSAKYGKITLVDSGTFINIEIMEVTR